MDRVLVDRVLVDFPGLVPLDCPLVRPARALLLARVGSCKALPKGACSLFPVDGIVLH